MCANSSRPIPRSTVFSSPNLGGSVRKVVYRNLQKLKDEGVIELLRKQIHLKSLQQLLEKLKY